MSQRHISIFSRFFNHHICSEFCRIHLKFSLPFQIPYLASISMSLYSTCLLVLVAYVPYWILVGTLRHLVEFSVVTRPLHYTQ
jgi:hypothetical protein